MTSTKSFLYTLAGAYAIFVAGMLSYNPIMTFKDWMPLDIFGIIFWACGIGNLFVDRKNNKTK